MIQIDIEMPACCDECFALDDNGDYPRCLISGEQRGYNFNTRSRRMSSCPLKEVASTKENKTQTECKVKTCCYCGTAIVYRGSIYCPMCGKRAWWDDEL